MIVCDWSEKDNESQSVILSQDDGLCKTTQMIQVVTIIEQNYDILGAAPGAPGLLAPPGPPALGLGPENPNLGGGVLSFLASRLLFLTTLEWMAQLTQ